VGGDGDDVLMFCYVVVIGGDNTDPFCIHPIPYLRETQGK